MEHYIVIMKPVKTVIRRLAPDDSLAEMTELLHRAYGRLAEMGLQYVATWQSEDITRERLKYADCFVAENDGKMVGTIAFYPPRETGGKAPDSYRNIKTAHFGQFAVDPDFQGMGLGSRMLEVVEEHARKLNFDRLAFDTSEKAEHLIKWYENRGYRFVEYVDWPETNYRSVIMARDLQAD